MNLLERHNEDRKRRRIVTDKARPDCRVFIAKWKTEKNDEKMKKNLPSSFLSTLLKKEIFCFISTLLVCIIIHTWGGGETSRAVRLSLLTIAYTLLLFRSSPHNVKTKTRSTHYDIVKVLSSLCVSVCVCSLKTIKNFYLHVLRMKNYRSSRTTLQTHHFHLDF